MRLPPPLFLLAPPRSFTSVINAMLGQHPQLYGLPELNLFIQDKLAFLWQRGPNATVFDPKLRQGILRTVAEIYTGEQTDEAIACAEHWCAARQHMTSAQVFQVLRERLAPLIPVDKSPAYTIDMSGMIRILDACPDARFIHLLRHPVKQCESTMALTNAMFPRYVNSIEIQEQTALVEPQIAWHDLNTNILNFLEGYVPPDQYLRLRGEDIMVDPEAKLKEISRWLGVRDDDDAVDAMMHPELSPFASVGPVTALYGNDPNFLRGAAFRRHVPKQPDLEAPVSWREDGKGLYPEVIEMAREFGY